MDLLDMNDYGPKINESFGCILVVIDNFSKFSWTNLSKNEAPRTRFFWKQSHFFEIKLIEGVDGREFVSEIVLIP